LEWKGRRFAAQNLQSPKKDIDSLNRIVSSFHLIALKGELFGRWLEKTQRLSPGKLENP
jgi:hypothetical protein